MQNNLNKFLTFSQRPRCHGQRLSSLKQKFKMASDPGFVPTAVNVEIEGDITVPGAPEEDEEPSTLDEPVSVTLVSLISNSFIRIWCRKF